MFSGREKPLGTANFNTEDCFAQIFERKRRIVEQVKQQVDLHDQRLLSKCLLAGLPPPPWLWSPSLPSQTSELNKEEIISGLLFPHSRPSIVCPSSRPFSYQQPASFLADNVVRQDLISVVNNRFEERLFEEEQCDLSHNLVGHVSNHSHQKDANIASPIDVQEEEGLQKIVSICCRENKSCPSSKYSQNQRVENSLVATSSGCSQGKTVPKSVSTTGCEQKPPALGYCQEETEPDTCLDPRLPLVKIQRSKSRQKDLKLRSSAKASKSHSNNRNELKPSPLGSIGLGIASLRSDSTSEIKLFKHDENDEGCQDEVEKSNSQGEEGDQCTKFSSTTESSTPHQRVDSVQKSSSGDAYASIVPESLFESVHVNEMDILQPIETIDKVYAKPDEQVDDPQSRSCNETAYLDAGTRSKSSSQAISKRKHPQSRSCVETANLDGGTRSKSSSQNSPKRKRQKSSNSFSCDFPSGKSNPSHCADHVVELPKAETVTNEVSTGTDAKTSISQSETITRSESNARGNRSKTKHSASDKASPIEVEPRDSISLLQGGHLKQSLNASAVDVDFGHVKEALNPSTDDGDGLVVENVASGNQSKEKGECVDTNRCSSAARASQTGISTDETTFAGTIQESISKTDLLGSFESSSSALQLSDSVMQLDDENVLLKPVTVAAAALLVEEDNNGDYIEIASILNSKSLSQTDITVVEPVVADSTIQEGSTPEDVIDHCKRCDISCGPKEVQPQGSLTKAGSSQFIGRISRLINSAVEEEPTNDNKVVSVGSDRKSADKQLEVRAETSSLITSDLPVFVKPETPHFDGNDEHNFNEIPMNSGEKSTREKAPTPASATRVFNVLSVTDSEVNLSADNGMKDNEDRSGLKIETELETESHASHTGLRVREDELLESDTITGHIDTVAKRPQHETFSVKRVSPISRNIACTEISESHGPESSIREFFCSGSSVGISQLQTKRRRTLDKLTSRVPSSSPRGGILDSDSDLEKGTCQYLDHYDDELQKMIGSASADQYAVELQKMMGSASSDELRFQECYLFKEAGLMSPALLSFAPEQLSVQSNQITPDHKVGSENTNFLPCAGETSQPLASCVVHDSDSSPVLEGFIISNDDENQTGSQNQIDHDSFQLPRTSAEHAAIMEQICKSARMTTPSFHLAKTFKFAGKMDLDQSVSTELLDGMYFSHDLEGSSVFDSLGINYDYTRKSYTDCLPNSGAGSSTDAKKNLCTSPAEKLWYRNLQKSSSSEKRVSQTPDLPCISEENENIDETESLCTKTPKSMSSEKRGISIPDLPCIDEENENIDEMSEAINEASNTERENVFDERKPLGDVNEDPVKFLPSVSDAMIPADRQSLDSVSTAFSFSAKCNSVKSKVRKQNCGKQRFTGKGKENQGGAGAGRNAKPPSSRVSKPKSSCNLSLGTLGPRLPDKEPRYNNIVSNISSFVPLVQQQKPAAPLVTGKKVVTVKALEAAKESKRIAEQKENERKMKNEARKLERARQEQENLKKQEIEKKKKEEDRKKKEAEMAWKQEMDKKKKEEERKRKEFEMADRKRQREEEDKKLKEAKRQRIAEMQRQQKEADQTLPGEKELKKQAKDARIKAQKEHKEDQSNADKNRGQPNTRIREVRPKSTSSEDTNASRNSGDDDFKVISNQVEMFEEESYDISPYKCSDDEDEEEEDDDRNISNHKFVPTWASKDNVLLGVISQQNRDPGIIFSAEGFCNISKILLPRKFQSR